MVKEVLFVILEAYADWETAMAAAVISDIEEGEERYVVKTVSLDTKPIKSIGGFTTVPDYDLTSAPEDFAALLLIGGRSWRKPEAAPVADLVRKARERNVPVGAICDGAVFLGMHGFLNHVNHTGNRLQALKDAAGQAYTNEAGFLNQQAVSDGGIVTANGTAFMDFTREVLIAMRAMPQEQIDRWYDFYTLGYYEALKKRGSVQ